ncbi:MULTISPECIES: pseudaminic acid biosynthesis protein PseG [Bacteroides]|jgi:UDP-2,4-diacetamido-2,4,6-trideoxy-beta-L-altropyranose hydrolase|uniref:pseudaminic acid biosynthesis protein PseG n=1 Tax=Bacteroides TaxID=816 RepID=UPI0001D8A410|nr:MULTISPECIES: pseudaminic acid biosynthesis protein PseG [Bacteroides]EFI02628.1 pseudaminic acid biosynthesis-associated protein PseG [Bacteroides sp. 1_1_14]MCA6039085.1 pseudaminic acid biosynthesis protein PseG [Bacteroides thetaiotaomicron]MCE8490896.1 pseudaminic acid biosynthesis protein PseG [Bacteroides thetaiotaomicron]MCE9152658.1 pseudaminic acid biosynthesis protein PseG [Bacteroides thetaiotaomicron]
MNKKIIFKADAGKHIGYGHFIRTLALADMLKDGYDCYFSTFEPTFYQLDEINKVCKYFPLMGTTDQFQEFLSLLNGDEIVVLDNYYYDTNFQKQIKRKGCKLVCIDGIHSQHFYCDIIFNPDFCRPEDYSVEQFTKLYIGLEWAFLRQPFINNIRKRKNNQITNVVIALGGADPYSLTDQVLAVLQNKQIQIKVIVGDTARVNIPCQNNVEVYSRISAEQIAELFNLSDLGIFSASTICNEAMACKLPIAAGYYVDNQIEYYHFLENNRLIYPLGNLLLDDLEDNINKVFTSMDKVISPVFDYKSQVTKIREIFEKL